MTTYKNQSGLFASPRIWVLEGATLEVSEAPHAPEVIPLADVTEVRLEYTPTRYEWNGYSCILKLKGQRKLTMNSLEFVGGFRRADRSASYVQFIRELHRRLPAHSAGCRYLAGASRSGFWWGTLALALAGLAVIGGIIFFSLVGWKDYAITKITLAGCLLPIGGLWIYRNRPRSYQPDALPAHLLPET